MMLLKVLGALALLALFICIADSLREGPQPSNGSGEYALWFERPSGAIERKVVDENQFWAHRRNIECKPRLKRHTLKETLGQRVEGRP